MLQPWVSRRVGGKGYALPPLTSDSDDPGQCLCNDRGVQLAYGRIPLAEAILPARNRSLTPDLTGASKKDVLDLTEKLNVRFMRLQFTDILGINKNVEIPASQFEKALAGDIMFDGSSIEGFVGIETSDRCLAPDLDTFLVYPWGDSDARICRLI